jgi:hypothetical protein
MIPVLIPDHKCVVTVGFAEGASPITGPSGGGRVIPTAGASGIKGPSSGGVSPMITSVTGGPTKGKEKEKAASAPDRGVREDHWRVANGHVPEREGAEKSLETGTVEGGPSVPWGTSEDEIDVLVSGTLLPDDASVSVDVEAMCTLEKTTWEGVAHEQAKSLKRLANTPFRGLLIDEKPNGGASGIGVFMPRAVHLILSKANRQLIGNTVAATANAPTVLSVIEKITVDETKSAKIVVSVYSATASGWKETASVRADESRDVVQTTPYTFRFDKDCLCDLPVTVRVLLDDRFFAGPDTALLLAAYVALTRMEHRVTAARPIVAVDIPGKLSR